jgi:diguanylate cyclase (GGDEF)-like protein
VDVDRLREVDLTDFVAYVDLCCPFCFALHERMNRWGLSERIQWRLVQHASHVITDTLRVEDGTLADEVASAARQAPDIGVRLPSHRPDPALAHGVVVHAQRQDPAWAHRLMLALYRALWREGEDLGDSDVLRAELTALGLPVSLLEQALQSPPDMLAAWQSDWENADYDLGIPVLAHPRSGRTMVGLPSQQTLARFLLGDAEDVVTAAVCHYQQRPLVVVSGWMSQLWEALADVRACCEVVHAPSFERSMSALTGPMRPCGLIVQREMFDEVEFESLLECARAQEVPWALATGEPSAEGEMGALAGGATAYLPLTEGGALARVRAGRMLAGALELAQLRQSRRTDALTQLPNQRAFEGLFAEALDRATRGRSKLSLMRIDLDHFKAFNKTFGHLASDDCLRTVAGLLDRQVREAGGILARHGGQEFVAVVPDTPHEQATLLAEGLRNAVCDAAIMHPRSPTADRLTVSVGLCTVEPPLGGGLPNLLGAAGRALASAKRMGRDQVAALDMGTPPRR